MHLHMNPPAEDTCTCAHTHNTVCTHTHHIHTFSNITNSFNSHTKWHGVRTATNNYMVTPPQGLGPVDQSGQIVFSTKTSKIQKSLRWLYTRTAFCWSWITFSWVGPKWPFTFKHDINDYVDQTGHASTEIVILLCRTKVAHHICNVHSFKLENQSHWTKMAIQLGIPHGQNLD